MLNGALVAGVAPLVEATSVYPLPALSIVRPVNVAIPATAFTVVVPLNVPPAGFDPIESVTALVAPASVFPDPSCTATLMAGIALPAAVFTGCPLKTNTGWKILNLALGAEVSAGLVEVATNV